MNRFLVRKLLDGRSLYYAGSGTDEVELIKVPGGTVTRVVAEGWAYDWHRAITFDTLRHAQIIAEMWKDENAAVIQFRLIEEEIFDASEEISPLPEARIHRGSK